MKEIQKQLKPQKLSKVVAPKRIYQTQGDNTVESLREELDVMRNAIASLADSKDISMLLPKEFKAYVQTIKGDDVNGES